MNRDELIAEYHELLAGDDGLTPEFFLGLKHRMIERRLQYGGRPIGVSLRPHFLTRDHYDNLTHSSEVVAGAFDKVANTLLSEPWRMRDVGMTERETRLALIDPGYSMPAVTTRLDAFLRENEIQFVEYNAENPSSLSDQAGLNEMLLTLAAMRAFDDRLAFQGFATVDRLRSALLETFQEWGGVGTPQVAIVDWDDLPTAEEFLLLREYFAAREIPTIICSPEELEYEKGRLRCGTFAIDLVYKRVIIHEFLERFDDSHPLIRAYVEGNICLVNSFRCKILHKKAAFELLTDPANERWFTSKESEVIRRTVPWTRRVAERKTSYGGRSIDLIEHIRRNRHEFVLKPNDDYGGHGVSLGDRVSESEWETLLASALNGDYVVQQKIELESEVFPIFDERGWSLQPMYVDTNPFLFRGKVDGAMVRLSDSPVVNVTSGGGETGFFVIEDLLRS